MRPAHPLQLRPILALFVALTLLLASSPARADSIAENVDGPWPTAKKIAVIGLGVAYVASTSFLFYSMAKESSANAHVRDDFPRGAGAPSSADCTNAAQCADLRSAVDDASAWHDRIPVAAVMMVGFGLATGATAALWPNGSTSVVPSASQQGAGLAVVGSF